MPTLYSMRHDGDQYRCTKFDDDMNVESSYLCTTKECQCPAGVRPMCRHREMLPKFLHRGAVGTDWFLDYDRGGWVQMGLEHIPEIDQPTSPQPPAPESMPPLPEGVVMMTLDDPVAVHNAIADAVGEPEAIIEHTNPAPTHVPAWRRF